MAGAEDAILGLNPEGSSLAGQGDDPAVGK